MRAQRAADVRHRHAAVVEPAAADAALRAQPLDLVALGRAERVVPRPVVFGERHARMGGEAVRARAGRCEIAQVHHAAFGEPFAQRGRHARRHAAHVADRRLAARVGRLPAIERDEARERGHVGHFLVQPDLERRRHAGRRTPGVDLLARRRAGRSRSRAADTARRAGRTRRCRAPRSRATAARRTRRAACRSCRAASGTTRRTSPARSRVAARRHAQRQRRAGRDRRAVHVVGAERGGVRGEEGEVGHHQASAGFFSRISKPSAPVSALGYRSTRLPRDRLRRRAHALRRA